MGGKVAARNAPEQRHLASLEAQADTATGPCLLALRALACRLALTIAFQFAAIIMARAIGLYCRHYRCFLSW